MQADFWHDKWERMEIGFHLQEVNKALLKYWPSVDAAAGDTVLIPLCGKTLDLVWLRQQGHAVVGIELSEIALDELASLLQEALDISLIKSREGDRVMYRGDGVLLIAGDFFAVTAELLADEGFVAPAVIYDRAAIVALPDSMRADYTKHLLSLSPSARQLLITLDYDQKKRSGPPFAVSDAEVEQHYATAKQVQRLEERELIDQEPRFREQGLDSFIQRVYLIE
ncbi:thiopurine S-methyltransferase [Thalassolituus marinus]|uniref:Thiopurine S-methyltransferase n=1 Tax=Thalassolituus marinus TaxID=671053 RepID=A0ABS7ZTT1_9GAMM|nr:thiopurine S-methyltransferase [Thalassolituus marinus]MCA6064638.1 thiopurine S-methyltransferase [Thalassolituus marinus]